MTEKQIFDQEALQTAVANAQTENTLDVVIAVAILPEGKKRPSNAFLYELRAPLATDVFTPDSCSVFITAAQLLTEAEQDKTPVKIYHAYRALDEMLAKQYPATSIMHQSLSYNDAVLA